MVTELINDIVSNAFNLSHKIKCEVCESMFSNIDSLKRHKRKFHEGNEKVKRSNNCNICLKSFTTPYKLKRHAEMHDTVKTINVCVICQKSCITPSKLKIHMKVHDKHKQYKCDQCNEEFVHENSHSSPF